MSRYDSKLKEGAQPFLADGEELLAAVIANPRGYTQSVAVTPNVGGVESALEQAMDAAGGRDVALGGGANTAQQYLKAGLIDEFQLHVSSVLLGHGARLFDNLEGAEIGLECTRVIEAPGLTHLSYRVVK